MIDRDAIIGKLSEELPVVGFRKDFNSFDIICSYQHQQEYRLPLERHQDYTIDELVCELCAVFHLEGQQ